MLELSVRLDPSLGCRKLEYSALICPDCERPRYGGADYKRVWFPLNPDERLPLATALIGAGITDLFFATHTAASANRAYDAVSFRVFCVLSITRSLDFSSRRPEVNCLIKMCSSKTGSLFGYARCPINFTSLANASMFSPCSCLQRSSFSLNSSAVAVIAK